MKVNIVGASAFVNRMFEACGQFQWARELLMNSIEAGAKRVQFGIVNHGGKYRRAVMDDGIGMDRKELLAFFSTLGEGAKKIGSVHENYGVGAKIATLPWNPEGVVVLSYKRGKGSMLQIILNRGTGEYELVDWREVGGSTNVVIDPDVMQWSKDEDWSAIKPSWMKDHGTIVVLCGSEQNPHTVFGNPTAEEADIKGLSTYLNTRFLDLSGTDVRVTELRSADLRSNAERFTNDRRVMGALHYVKIESSKGKLAKHGVIPLMDGRVAARWFLWQGERPHVGSYAQEGGYIAVRYKDELYYTTSGKVPFRWFGVVEPEVQRRLTIILEPQEFNGRWGVYPDQSRARLLFTSGALRGAEIPMVDFGAAFADAMPDAIREAVQAAREQSAGTIEDDEYRRRLQDRFGARWMQQTLIPSKRSRLKGFIEDEDVRAASEPVSSNASDGGERDSTLEGEKRVRTVNKRGRTDAGSESLTKALVPVDVPSYRYGHAGDFEKPFHLASWLPHDPSGPTVLINLDAPVLSEAIAYHVAQYPEVYADEVTDTVRKTFGEVAVAKVAHSQKLSTDIPTEELDATYRSEQALTVSLMGLLAEESLIGQRLRKLGRRSA